eukprot:GEMP01008308.1.p1 GENE.GEMP01008308.1~~GEMP01008308.1.p1  ORF type:complete len:597 (+),score=71.03 GEMP01008308.1:99-1793(+)
MDYLSKSDPIVLVYMVRQKNQPEGIGQTEIIDNNLNPDWATSVSIDYYFEEEQTVICKVLDVDDDKVTFKDADFIGQTAFHLAKLVSAQGQTLTQKLTLPNSSTVRGMITIRAEELNASNQLIHAEFSVPNLPNNVKWYNFLWHKPDPTLIIRRSREDGTWVKVCQTEVLESTTHPKWKKLSIKASQLCNGDLERPIKLEVADFSHGSEDAPILVTAETCVRELEQMDGRNKDMFGPDSKKRKVEAFLKSYVQVEQRPSFLDYIKGGLQLNLHVAIDFTASNGDPYSPNSLHYTDPTRPNQYQQVIQAVGNILSYYDSDQMYPVVGFGGKINGQVSHCFALDPNGHEVHGIHGVLQAYSTALRSVALSGPTLFAPLIHQLNSTVSRTMHVEPYSYNIQLILTDGEIHDMDNTVDAIVQSSRMPISVIIVGIGNANFSNMDTLDADGSLLRARNGDMQAQDNVQFVPYNTLGGSATRLAREVLMELPDQVVSHFVSRNMPPKAPLPAAPLPSLQHASTGLSASALFGRSSTNAFVTSEVPSAPPAQVPETIPEHVQVAMAVPARY